MKPKIMAVAASLEDFLLAGAGMAARYAEQGSEVHLVILSGNEQSGAAKDLGVSSAEFFGYEGKPLQMDKERIDHLATAMRKIRPDLILTHARDDLFHPDQELVRQSVMTAYQAASGAGYRDGFPVSPRQTPIFGFEPGDPERAGFVPMIYLNISGVIEKKQAAMRACGISEERCAQALKKAELRAARCSANRETPCRYAEAFSSFGPIAKHGYFVW